MRIVAGNWKMHKTRREAKSLAEEIVERQSSWADVDVLLFPPFTSISAVAEACQGSGVVVGGQNFHAEPAGAFTGEISARMLLEAGAESVLIGHSERRTLFEEGDSFLADKLKAAIGAGLRPIFCIGEDLEMRESGRTEAVLSRQIELGLGPSAGLPLSSLVVAYEPVWAIGTGRVASLEQIEAAHQCIREEIARRFEELQVPILYGGSVKGENAASILGLGSVDGVLVGGASLDVGAFESIARA